MRCGKDDIVMIKKLTVGLLALCLVGEASKLYGQETSPTTVWREDSMQEVVVTGTGTQHLLKDAPVQTEVISHRQLQQYAGKSIEDILSGLTASFAFNESDMGSGLQMNGLGNSYVLILVDGRRLHGDNGGENDLQLIDPHHIEKIEIVKGASSALYGSDAIAGVINIITKKIAGHASKRANSGAGTLGSVPYYADNTTRYGSHNDLRQHNSIAFNIGRIGSQTNFQLQHSDGWQNTAEEAIQQTEYHITDSRNKTVNRHTNWQLSERLTYQLTPAIELYADGNIYWKRIYRPCGHHPGVDVKTWDLQYNNASASVGGKWKLNSTDVITLDADWKKHAYRYAYTDTTLTDGYVNGHFTNYFPYFPGDKELQSDQRLTNISLKGIFALPYEQRLSAGLDYRYDWLKAPMRVAGGKATDHTEAVYAQDELELLDPLYITAGLRLTRNEGFGTRLTPKLSAMLKLGELRLRATWSQGYKTPTPKELHYQYIKNMNGVYLYLGNEDLKAQTSDYWGMSVEYTIGHLTLTLAPYYNKVNDMITLVTIPTKSAPGDLISKYDPIRVRQYQNMEDAKTYGVDFTVRYQGRHFTAGGSYSYLDTEANQYDSENDVMHKVTIDGMAHHKANVYATWNHECTKKYTFGIGVYGRLSSKRYYQIDGDGKGYQLWRLSTNHQIGKLWRIDAGIDNIFNYVDRTPHGLHLGTTTPGRTFYASLTVCFQQGKKLTNKYKSNFNSNNNDNEQD